MIKVKMDRHKGNRLFVMISRYGHSECRLCCRQVQVRHVITPIEIPSIDTATHWVHARCAQALLDEGEVNINKEKPTASEELEHIAPKPDPYAAHRAELALHGIEKQSEGITPAKPILEYSRQTEADWQELGCQHIYPDCG